jgi:hypothetical protein
LYLQNKKVAVVTIKECGCKKHARSCPKLPVAQMGYNLCEESFTTLFYPSYPPAQSINYLAWYPEVVQIPSNFAACFVKLHIINGLTTYFEARSVIGTFIPPSELPTDLYGIRSNYPASNNDAICLQVKQSGFVTNGLPSGPTTGNDQPLVTIQQSGINKLCEITINQHFLLTDGDNIVDPNDKEKLQFYLQDKAYGQDYGLYCEEGPIERDVYAYALEKCIAGGDYIPQNRVRTTDNWLVQFTCLDN